MWGEGRGEWMRGERGEDGEKGGEGGMMEERGRKGEWRYPFSTSENVSKSSKGIAICISTD